ncbi:Chromatin structure-remodeling complex subunit snf21 [Grifola frondosa]|uniref:Chromatin structure-remodeling complex subunit snf21 n=1 Tax=Grifola frondosa TaxID=5627 RepID=A0A1C7MQU0_GRIFR|nr:Chromatin structure-remodeling complex subunit snf21 [Grifola frondosa]
MDDAAKNDKENAMREVPSLNELMHPGPNTHGKLRALIELKGLRVVEKQRALRALVAERLTHGSLLPLNRVDFRRVRKPALRDVRTTENSERRQRLERERRAKQKHVEQLRVICDHGNDLRAMGRASQDRITRLGRAVLSFHAHTEREEQKRIERISKERLRALKADDEEAYMKLIDTAKDTRITHLLKQTDAYLDSLAQAVMEQQRGDGHDVTQSYYDDEGPANEATFGAKTFEDEHEDKGKLDYYAVAHRIKEKITKQPSILVGGTLKDYQLKGLQWMVSLYNNKLDGILADEMGLGKTIQTISLITFLIETKKQRGPYLVIVPLSTMTNWSGEFAKWAPSVRMISYKGNPAQRKILQAELRSGNFQVVLTTYEYIIKDRVFNSVKSFDEWFNTPFANSGTGDKIELNEEEALLIIRRLHKVLRPFLLRRLKKDVESELPDKVEKVIKVRMSALQSQLYKQMKKYKMIADGKDSKGKSGGVKGLSNELMQLRKICQHPFLFESVEDNINPGSVIDDKLIRIRQDRASVPHFTQVLHDRSQSTPVLIFFQMTKVMDIMEDFLKMMGWKYLRLDGGTKTEDRAGHGWCLGLNLQTADTVIIFDSDWNPHADLQAQDRAHRIGQTKVVRILRFITEKSVEEAMFARARYKLDIDDKVIQAGRFDNKSTQEEQEEFLRSILEADQEEENEEAGDMNDDEINEIISRSDEESALFREVDIQRERDALEAWRKANNRGKPPPPLMQLEELPEFYRTDEPFEDKNELEGWRVGDTAGERRSTTTTDSAMTSGRWLWRTVKICKSCLSVPGKERKEDTPRGRKGKKGKGKMTDLDMLQVSGKRKRGGGKSTSMTPSVVDDDEDDRDTKRRKTKVSDILAPIRDKMKKAFKSVIKLCQAARMRRVASVAYPDYYQLIEQPIALSTIRKRINGNQYKSVLEFRDDMRLMFNNARTYNQEGSYVYMNADEMEKVFNAVFERTIAGSGLPGAPPGPGTSASYDAASTPMDDDERPCPKARG